MIFDARTTLADNVAAGATTGVQLGSSLDIAATGIDGNVDDNVGGVRDIGNGRQVFLTLLATEAFVGTSTTDHVTYSLVSSDNAGLTGYVTHLITPTWTYGTGTDTLPGGTNLGKTIYQGSVPLEGFVPYKRYVGLIENVTGATTTGKVTAFLSLDPNSYKYYPQADVNL